MFNIVNLVIWKIAHDTSNSQLLLHRRTDCKPHTPSQATCRKCPTSQTASCWDDSPSGHGRASLAESRECAFATCACDTTTSHAHPESICQSWHPFCWRASSSKGKATFILGQQLNVTNCIQSWESTSKQCTAHFQIKMQMQRGSTKSRHNTSNQCTTQFQNIAEGKIHAHNNSRKPTPPSSLPPSPTSPPPQFSIKKHGWLLFVLNQYLYISFCFFKSL